MPVAMNCAQAVFMDGKMYVGGGTTGEVRTDSAVFMHDPEVDTWSPLPNAPYRYTTMATLNNQLVLAGGRAQTANQSTNQITVWDSSSQEWTHPYPPMPTARRRAAAVGYLKWLAVAGGVKGPTGSDRQTLNTVELLDSTSRQWYFCSPLPVPTFRVSSTFLEDKWYLAITPSKDKEPSVIVHTSLPAFISQAISQSKVATQASQSSTPSLWKTLPNIPVRHPTITAYQGLLLHVGGGVMDNQRTSAMQAYLPHTDQWVKVGNMPIAASHRTCIVLPESKLLLIGGWNNLNKRITQVDMAT